MARREHRRHQCAVLGQTAIIRLHITELSLDHSNRMHDRCPDRCLGVF